MTNKARKLILIYLLALLTPLSLASPSNQIRTKIDNVLKEYTPNANVGIIVESIADYKILYQKNPNKLFIPASSLKILPAISALSLLGPSFYFQTKILAKNTHINRGTVNYDLYIYFDGDPSLTQKDLKNLVKQLSTLGIKKITGDIYIDDTIFDQELLGSGWMWEDLNFCYASPISAAILDKNCLSFKLISAKKPGQLATLINSKSYIPITNKVITKNFLPGDKSCKLKLNAANNNNYLLSGCLKPKTKPLSVSIAIRNVRSYIKNWLLAELKTSNINLTGQIKFGKTPTYKQSYNYVFAYHQSAPLSDLITTMLKRSDNTIADAIHKKLGQFFFSKQATWKQGSLAIKNILESATGWDFKEMYLDDGSGLSRHNQITPNLIVKSLVHAYNNPHIKQHFIDALPHAGIDGTIEKRMLNLKNRVYAKTGNMGSVSSLVGYIKTKTEGVVAFAIMINSFLGKPKKLHVLQDEICNIIADS